MPSLFAVPVNRVDEVWRHAAPFIAASLEEGGGLLTVQEVQFDVFSQRALLWVALEEGQMLGAGATKILMPERVLEIQAWGSDDQERCAPLLATVEQYAREQGCKAIRVVGRKGWERVLPGFSTVAVILEKAL